MAKKLVFKEIDVTNETVEHLIKIFVVTRRESGWFKYIENLEMIVADGIIVRGWATKAIWKRFEKLVINDHSSDYIYRVCTPEDLGY